MLQRILKILTDKKWSWVFLLGIMVTIVGVRMMVNYNQPIPQSKTAIFGQQKLKPIESFTLKDNLSAYDKFMQEKKKGEDRTYGFNPRVKIVEGGGRPLRFLYREKKVEKKEQEKPTEQVKKEPSKKPSSTPEKPKKEEPPKEKEQIWSQSATNPESMQEHDFFKAIIRERQAVYDGKPIKIVLLEPIPELALEAGTTLKGPATLLNSARIKIHITAAEGSRKKIDLDCFDSEDLLEGIYNDELARQLEEYAKESLVDELLDLDFQGKRIAQKAHNLTRIAKKIMLEEGKEIFVSLSPKEEKED